METMSSKEVRVVTSADELKEIYPLIHTYFAITEPDYSESDFTCWAIRSLKRDDIHFLVAYENSKPVGYAVILLEFQEVGSSRLRIMQVYFDPRHDSTFGWRYILKIAGKLNLPLIVETKRPFSTMRKYGFEYKHTVLERTKWAEVVEA